MSLPKTSSGPSSRVAKRNTFDTILENADKSSEEDTRTASAKKRKLEPHTHSYDVYVVKFLTGREGSDFHRALLVEYSKQRSPHTGKLVSKGELFEVTGPVQVTGKSICKYVFDPKNDQAPEDAEDFVPPKVKLGRLESNKLDTFFVICESVHPPRGPLDYYGSPDCNDWLNNVIVKLKQRGIVDIDDGYTLPTKEVSMVWMTGTT